MPQVHREQVSYIVLIGIEMEEKLDSLFHLKERGTNVKTEFIAGLTTFVTVAYVLAVNPSVLADAGMDHGAVFTASCLICIIGSLLMAFLTNFPFLLVPSMGLNAYFTYTIVIGMGYSWQVSLAAVIIEGVVFAIISLTKLRDLLADAIPFGLKKAITAGIGLFITIIGLKGSGLLQPNESTYVSMISFNGTVQEGTFSTLGICALLALAGIVITAVLMAKNVKGNILIGIVATWVLGMICEVCGLYVPNPDAGFYTLFPSFANGLAIPSLAPVAFQADFSQFATVGFIAVVIAILFASIFDTLGTLIGTTTKAGLADADGNIPGIGKGLIAEAVTTICAGFIGSSPTCVAVESNAGVAEGGRTGLTAVFGALMFAIALFLSPIFLAIPSFATAPALVIVGFLMIGACCAVDWDDPTEGVPAFITLAAMPFFYSIAEGVFLGIISYTLINALAGRGKKVSPLLWVLTVLFIIKYFFI